MDSFDPITNDTHSTVKLELTSNLPGDGVNDINENFEIELTNPKTSVKNVYKNMIEHLVEKIMVTIPIAKHVATSSGDGFTPNIIWAYISSNDRNVAVKLLTESYKKTWGDWYQEINGLFIDFGYNEILLNSHVYYSSHHQEKTE